MHQTDFKYITANIRRIREQGYISQEYVAVKLGICQNAYSKLEIGKTRLTIERLFQIADILETDVTVLLKEN